MSSCSGGTLSERAKEPSAIFDLSSGATGAAKKQVPEDGEKLGPEIARLVCFIADDIETSQTPREQTDKSRGLGPEDSPFAQSAAEVHATLRLGDGFDIDQMVSEYRALRASVVKQWMAGKEALAATDLDELTRFNEAIDQAMTESVAKYTEIVTNSRNIFLGVLGHDLRNPIGAASMAAQAMVKMGVTGARQTRLASQIVDTTQRATAILNDLLDITRSAFGADLPMVKAPMNMGQLAIQLRDEMRALSEGRSIETEIIGNTEGEWDRIRIGQVFSNLIGNAIQYSPPASTVSVTVSDRQEKVVVSVNNEGAPISSEKIKTIFDFMTRGNETDVGGEVTTNLGLGLFIAKKIVSAHVGEITVTSDANTGTTFTVILPRR
ncbi:MULTISPECIES: HAMP domain-containing sensor histidine kinase [unclassified Chelatococcus]|uniref:sensor histidine kinase n=1 Tax=unclassified Chelatococcus TaxID=2638111 RepID=UPI0020BE4667|nr:MULTISPECIES: HAMP domain-containing sensor histidine kinase [unclassified Chelatococcus]MCO5079994.1 HAMP domain-containing histidine kinase [Chelatococcus sp.]CAH1663950.1 Histidine kinase [Hyphomicrobiales bacterium]CAH1687997.1 Histidine kinase [Hyphomicrobiales bacterium]